MTRFLFITLSIACAACAAKQPPATGAPESTPAPSAAPATPAASSAGSRRARPTPAPAPARTDGAAAQTGPAAADAPAASERPDRLPPPDIKPYDRVITKEAKSDPGIFTVHRVKEKVYYEVPKSALGRDFLWVSQIARTTVGAGYGGQAAGNRVVRWERRDSRVLLRGVSYEIVADRAQPIARAVEAANFDAILMAFNVEAVGKDDAPVIEVTRLFTTEVPEFNARARIRARTFDQSRAFVERVKAFPQNIEVEAIHTFTTPTDPPTGAQAPPSPFAPPPARPGSSSVLMHYSMVLLPEKPMAPRLHDERVGFFSVAQRDFGQDEHRAPERRYITRWRLEKRDPKAALSEPIKPIVYYVDPATPAKWVPFVKRGIEQWQPAFEAAGFRGAIVAKDAPSATEDPEWSPEDARYSVVRWLPSTIENASGPHIHDPRTGEILESDIQMYHNVMNLLTHWYFVQAGPLDPRAQKLPLPDELMGVLVEYVVAHEVGHTLGLPHNMKASSMYPIEKVRDREWVKVNSHTPTLMDYSRFNYVAQPEDAIAAADLIPKIGPYDRFSIMWGYKPVEHAAGAEAEKPTLDEWARQQDQTAWLRFSTANSRGADPGELTEAVGDADAIQATTLGLKNLERVSSLLLSAATKPGEPFDDLGEVYGRMLGQWALEMNHVAAIVGGFQSQQKHGGQTGVIFAPIARERQAAAVKFLNAQAFQTPAIAVKPEILRRIEPAGILERVRGAQQRVLTSLLSTARLGRLVEQEALDGAISYKATDFLADVRKGIWSEVYQPGPVKVDAFRRNLQRAYLDTLADRVNGRQAASDDARAFFREELRSLDADLRRAAIRTADRASRAHVEDARAVIERALDPSAPAVPAAATGPRPTADGVEWHVDGVPDEVACWPDYAVRIAPDPRSVRQ